jgi:hypothetical protein
VGQNNSTKPEWLKFTNFFNNSAGATGNEGGKNLKQWQT